MHVEDPQFQRRELFCGTHFFKSDFEHNITQLPQGIMTKTRPHILYNCVVIVERIPVAMDFKHLTSSYNYMSINHHWSLQPTPLDPTEWPILTSELDMFKVLPSWWPRHRRMKLRWSKGTDLSPLVSWCQWRGYGWGKQWQACYNNLGRCKLDTLLYMCFILLYSNKQHVHSFCFRTILRASLAEML